VTAPGWRTAGRRLLGVRRWGGGCSTRGRQELGSRAMAARRESGVISARRNLSSTAAWHDDRQEEEEEDGDVFLCGLQAATVLMQWPHSGIPVSVSAEIAGDGLGLFVSAFQSAFSIEKLRS
jgi:hypothetical protein